jgi:hypothetical protein
MKNLILLIIVSVMTMMTGLSQDNKITIKGDILNTDERTTIHVISESGDTSTVEKGNHYKLNNLSLDQSYNIVFIKGELIKCLHIQSTELVVHDAIIKYTMLLDIDWRDKDNYAFLCYSPIKRNFVLTSQMTE